MRTITPRFAFAAAVVGALLISGPAFAQKEQEARVIRLDEGISVRVPPIWHSRPLAANAAGNQNGTCNFASPSCPTGFTCSTGRGAPKYGDYNASACAAGRLFTAWTSATTPTGSTTPAAGLSTFARTVQPR